MNKQKGLVKELLGSVAPMHFVQIGDHVRPLPVVAPNFHEKIKDQIRSMGSAWSIVQRNQLAKRSGP